MQTILRFQPYIRVKTIEQLTKENINCSHCVSYISVTFVIAMGKSYECNNCLGLFKSSASLASHRYRYHPYLRNEGDLTFNAGEDNSFKFDSEISNITLETKIQDNEKQIQSLDQVFDSLKRRIEVLESANYHTDTNKDKQFSAGSARDTQNTNKTADISKELNKLRFQSDLNTSKIELLQKRIKGVVNIANVSDSDTGSSSSDEEIIRRSKQLPDNDNDTTVAVQSENSDSDSDSHSDSDSE